MVAINLVRVDEEKNVARSEFGAVTDPTSDFRSLTVY